jgi:hypothetical protein
MDIRDINRVFVAANCARTSGGAETIDGDSVSGVQVHAKLVDAGTAAGTYYGAGELVITDSAGKVLNSSTATKAANPSIAINQRSADGNHVYAAVNLKGSKITSYNFTPYAAKVEQVTVITSIDDTLTDHTYMLKIRRLGTDNNRLKRPSVKTAYFKSAAAGSTEDQIFDGLATYINANFQTDEFMPVRAVADAVNSELRIYSMALPWEIDRYKYDRLSFEVILVNFTGTIASNMYADLVAASATYSKATLGAGSYYQVAEMESQAKLNTGVNRDKVAKSFTRYPEVALDAQKYEDDGTTANRYDTVVINWENIQGDFQAGVKQQGSVTIFLPMDNNDTNQQADIIATLNKYIATDHGVGTAITLST